MSVPLSHDFVRNIYAEYARADIDSFAQRLDEEIDWLIYAPISLFPFAGPRHGKPAVLRAIHQLQQSYALLSYNPTVLMVDGDRAAVLSDVSFQQRASGRVLRFLLANFLHFRDGRIVEFRELMNTIDVVEQVLGHEIV